MKASVYPIIWLVLLTACSRPQECPTYTSPLAPDVPEQIAIHEAERIVLGRATLTPRAAYRVTAIVRGTHRYDRLWSLDPAGDVAPLDLALAWGPYASRPDVMAKVSIGQGARFYFWHTSDGGVYANREELNAGMANTHLVPADDRVRARIDKIEEGDQVTLIGELVDVRVEDRTLTTSLSRTDDGAGACEILLVRDVEIVQPNFHPVPASSGG